MTKSLLQLAKLSYLQYDADLVAKQRLLEQANKVEKQTKRS